MPLKNKSFSIMANEKQVGRPRKQRKSTRKVSADASVINANAYMEPEVWTIVSALNRVLEVADETGLEDELWEKCRNPLAFLREQLQLTDVQIVILAVLVEAGEPMSWRKLGKYLQKSRLAMMVYSEEVEDMVKKRWFVKRGTRESNGFFEGFALVRGVVTALRHNKVFEPEKIDGLNEQEFVDLLERYVPKEINEMGSDFSDVEWWMTELVKSNPDLPICRYAQTLDNEHETALMLLAVVDYAQWADSDVEGLSMGNIDKLFPDEFECDFIRTRLRDGNHRLLEDHILEFRCDSGMADSERFMLTDDAKTKLLSDYKPSRSKCISMKKSNDGLLKAADSIKEKMLFYNANEEEQIARLTDMLTDGNLKSIQNRLEEQGMRKGFACLFYGDPGTGKTETVLQIARTTGRDIMQVNIAGLRDKWVGGSEKNIKAVFTNYRKACQQSDVMPILLFNEADAIIGKRTENVGDSVEKMDNAMQNIILQEMEDLDGILIATTNLTSNLDRAFERRFLFKVEFRKPETSVKEKIWSSMLKNISKEEASLLAREFDFSGGQIENIARKRTIDYILSGKYADVEDIEKYCRNELIEDKRKCSSVVGFHA